MNGGTTVTVYIEQVDGDDGPRYRSFEVVNGERVPLADFLDLEALMGYIHSERGEPTVVLLDPDGSAALTMRWDGDDFVSVGRDGIEERHRRHRRKKQ